VEGRKGGREEGRKEGRKEGKKNNKNHHEMLQKLFIQKQIEVASSPGWLI